MTASSRGRRATSNDDSCGRRRSAADPRAAAGSGAVRQCGAGNQRCAELPVAGDEAVARRGAGAARSRARANVVSVCRLPSRLPAGRSTFHGTLRTRCGTFPIAGTGAAPAASRPPLAAADPVQGRYTRSGAPRATGDATAAVKALLDRLLHRAHVFKCGPRSWRTKAQTLRALIFAIQRSLRIAAATAVSRRPASRSCFSWSPPCCSWCCSLGEREV